MTKLIIYIEGRPLVEGYTIREFQWSEVHRAHIYEGKEIEAADFNEIHEKSVRTNGDLLPRIRVRVIEVQDAPAPAKIDLGAVRAIAPVPPSPTITREPTVEEAEAVMRKFAPHRLRAKPGPKPSPVAAEEI